jgi:phosphatidylserine decarboxylase
MSVGGAFREKVFVDLLRWAPKGAYSRLVGLGARAQIPTPLRAALYGAFVRRTGINVAEMERPLTAYPSFDALFTRRLKPGARTVEPSATVVAPCDGVVVASGVIERGRLLQVKGRDYTLRALLVDSDAAHPFDRGRFVTIYLSPRDYHRVHVPVDGTIRGYRHLPGALFPVHPSSMRRIGGLLTVNERLVTYLDSDGAGAVGVVMVAAAGVGNIQACYDTVETRGRSPAPQGRILYPSPRAVLRGDELGVFHLGSTVVVLLERGKSELVPLEEGEVVRMGQPLAARSARAVGVI